YNPTQALSAVNQLVLYDNVFGIFQGVGTATHALAAPFLNSERVPDLFVASGCPCWADGVTQPYTYGWQPSGKIEGKLLGWYIQRHFRGQKVGILYQNDDAG